MEQGRSIKGTVIRTIIFAALWLASFIAAYFIVLSQHDIAATYFTLNFWQLVVLLPAYYFMDKKYLEVQLFKSRRWCLPVVGVLISFVLFIPLGFVVSRLLIFALT